MTPVFKRVVAEPIRTLFFTEPDAAIPVLPQGLRTHYDGDLQFPSRTGRPYVVANFVSTLDGAVSFALPGLAGGGPISGGNDGDRFIMGLLRASADGVLVASGTVTAVSPEHLWLPEFIYPSERDSYAYYRSVLKKAAHPLIVIVSGSGNLELIGRSFTLPASGLSSLQLNKAKAGWNQRRGRASIDRSEAAGCHRWPHPA